MELKEILTTTTVGELVLPECPQLAPSATVLEAVESMRSMSHGCAAVCRDGRLCGIFTERDLLRVIADGKLNSTLETVMTADPETVFNDDSLLVATDSMDRGGYRRLPVVNSDGGLVGVLDVKTIAHFIVEHFPTAVYNQASHAQLIAKHREGA